MNSATKIFLVGAAFVLSAGAQAKAQAGAQANDQAATQATVPAEKTQAQVSGGASASSSASAESKQTNAGLASGTAFNAALNAPIDSKKCKPGDAVTAHTTENVKADGKTVLPKGSKLVGHVTQATARAKGDSESALAITFDRAILKNGEEVPLNIAIQAVAAAQTAGSAPDADVDTMGSAGTSAAGSGMAGGRGAAGGLTSTAGTAVGSVSNTAGAGDAALHSTVRSTTGVTGASRGAVGGLSTAGELTSNSRGVFNMNGLTLNAAAVNGTQTSVITSAGKNVHLDSGTRMLMVTEATASATPNR
jgi:type IV secretory pathway VirB10-like protein